MSIRTRLTIWYTAPLAVSLLAIGLLIYSLVGRILISNLDERLRIEAEDVVALVQSENEPLAVMLSGRVQLPAVDAFGSQYFIQIVQRDGHALQSSENLGGQRLPLPRELMADNPDRTPQYVTVDAGAVRLRITSRPIRVGPTVIGIAEVAASMTSIEDALGVIRHALLIGSLLALLLSAVAGNILAYVSVRPIKAITETAQRITGTEDLSQRIPVTVPGDELGKLIATINDMLARLQTAFDAQQQLVADVSHELRTPLTAIQGNLDLLRRGADEDPDRRAEALRAIAEETARMRRMIADLLLLAEADAGLKLHLEPVELDTLLLDLYRQAQIMADGTGVTVRLGAEDQAVVRGDEDRLRQLLLNLVDNALKYTPAGGHITLMLQRNTGGVAVSVQDTGIGIAREDLPQVFDRFFRAERSRARPGGSGLGLAIARWIAEAHGGRLEAESEPGRGSTFTLWLPTASSEEAQEMNVPSTAQRPGASRIPPATADPG